MYVRTVGSDTLTFGVSGLLWKDAMVMYDRETGSNWSHITGQAITGPLTGTVLETYPAVHTTWEAWVEAYPKTKVLKKPVLYGSSYKSYDADPRRLGIHGRRLARSRLPAKSKVIGFQLDGAAQALPLPVLEPGSIIQPTVSGVPLLVYTDPAGEGVTIWRRELGQATLDFTLSEKPSHSARASDGRVFDLLTGRPTGGGEPLVRIQTTKAYWFGWHNFYPESQVVTP